MKNLILFNIFNNFTNGLIFFDEKNKLILINPKAEKILNIMAKKLLIKKQLT